MELTMSKKNNLFKLLIVLLTFITVFTLSGCEDGLDYSDFKSSHLDTFEDVLTQEHSQYLVYYYGPTCSHCITIKDDVLNFALENEADVKVFFIDASDVKDSNEYPLYDPTTGDPVEGTPTMFVVKNGVLRDMNVGASKITSLLEKINEGSYGIIE